MASWRGILSALRQAGHSAWLVGGCVRDLLLGLAPKDFDIATSATPAEILGLFPEAEAIGAHFGVVLVRGVEVATYRRDGLYTDGRRPDRVEYASTPEEDAQRRDFTINGLYYDPGSGEVLDTVGGRADLAAGVVRAIGDPARRFAEDHLRLLRAVRFAARFGFGIERGTSAAMRDAAGSIHGIAVERVFQELTRILTEGGAARGMELLWETGLLAELLPEVVAMRGVEQPPQYHPEGDVWVHTLRVLAALGPAGPALAWAALLHDVGKPATFSVTDRIRFNGHDRVGAGMAEAILGRLKAPVALRDRVAGLVAAHMGFLQMPRMRPATLKRFLRAPDFPMLLELHRLDCLGGRGELDSYEFALEQLGSFDAGELRPAPLLTGRDVLAAGVPAGPRVGTILAEVEEAQLEGRLAGREAALEWLSRRVLEPSST